MCLTLTTTWLRLPCKHHQCESVQQSDTRNTKCLRSYSSSSTKKENVHGKNIEPIFQHAAWTSHSSSRAPCGRVDKIHHNVFEKLALAAEPVSPLRRSISNSEARAALGFEETPLTFQIPRDWRNHSHHFNTQFQNPNNWHINVVLFPRSVEPNSPKLTRADLQSLLEPVNSTHHVDQKAP